MWTPHTLLYLSTESQCRVCAQPLQKAVSVIHDQVVADIQPTTYNLHTSYNLQPTTYNGQPTIYRPGLPDPLPLAAPSPAPRAGGRLYGATSAVIITM